MTTYRIALSRLADPGVAAIVSVTTSVEPFGVKGAIRRAIADWVRTSQSGRAAIKQAGGNIGIETLALWANEGALQRQLRRQQIHGLAIDLVFPPDQVMPLWAYDDTLVEQPDRTGGPVLRLIPGGKSLAQAEMAPSVSALRVLKAPKGGDPS